MRPLAALLAACGSLALAHGFGERYDLPVPLWLYLWGAGAAVLLSFVVLAYFLRAAPPRSYPRLNLLAVPGLRLLFSRPVVRVLQIASVLVFLLTIATGLFGTSRSEENLAPLVVWVLWWVGVAYASALLGHVWRLLNPWSIVFGWAEGLAGRGDPDARSSVGVPYPRWLSAWPSVVLFFAFAWLELVHASPARPFTVASAVLLYSAVTWGGMLLFGRQVWLRHGEAFTLVFGLLARFAPTEVRVKDASRCAHAEGSLEEDGGCVDCWACFEEAAPEQRELNLRPFGVGLLRDEQVSPALTALTVLLLASVTFDGFTATSAWWGLVSELFPLLGGMTAVGTAGLLGFAVLFGLAYLLTCTLIQTLAGERGSLLSTARSFVLTLVPIALAYHLAHYLTYLLVQSQLVVPLASDPFGLGWDLFGTADAGIDINVLGARFAWFTAVVAIVVGHIVAVYLAHVVAMRRFTGRGAALRSQLPMMVLMVAYTVISLWILAQPIVEGAPSG